MPPTTGVSVTQYVSGQRHPRGAGALAISVLTGLVVLQRLDATLGAMQPPGSPSATATGLASPSVLRDLEGHFEGVQAWAAWDLTRPGGWGSPETLAAYAVVDSVLVALALGWLLLLLNAAVGGPALATQWGELRSRLSRRRDETAIEGTPSGEPEVSPAEPPPPSAQPVVPSTQPVASSAAPWEPSALLVSVPLAAVSYALFDVLENVSLVVTRLLMWQGGLAAAGVLSTLKWLALLAAVLPLVVVGLANLARRGAERVIGAGGTREPTLPEEVFALRAQLVVVLLLIAVVVLPGELGKQIDDALLVLRGRPVAAALTLIGTVLLCVVIRSSGRWCLFAYERAGGSGDLTTRSLIRLGVGGAIMLGLGIDSIVGERWLFANPPFVALLVPGALLVAYVLLSLPSRKAPTSPWETRSVPRRVLRWFSVAPMLVVGLVGIRAGVLVLVTGEIAKSAPFWLLGAVLVVSAGAVAVRPKPFGKVSSTQAADAGSATSSIDRLDVVAGVGVAIAVAVGIWGGISPLTAGPPLGTWTLLLAFLAILLSLLTVLVVLGDRLPARGVLAAVGLRRVPLMSLFAACVVLTSVVDSGWRYHDTRLVEAQPTVASATVTLQDATKTWLETGKDDADAGGDAGGEEEAGAGVRPLVLIAASGGGKRAAYWTSAVLSCVFSGSTGDVEQPEQPPGALVPVPADDPLAEADPCAAPEDSTPPDEDDVLIASGISGSSVGLVVRRALGDEAPQYTGALADDFLAANMAAYLFRDAPNSLLRRLPVEDRAAILEQSWEEAVERSGGDLTCGLLAASREEMQDCGVDDEAGLRFPLLMLNSVGADDACRITASTLDLGLPAADGDDSSSADGRDCRSLTGPVRSPLDPSSSDDRAELPGTRDAHDHTCAPGGTTAHDVRLSTAAHLSARFPYVSPTGRLLSCAVSGDATYALDGGVIESSAASPLQELWPALLAQVEEWNRSGRGTGPCVVPRLMLLDNGYASLVEREDATRPLEATAPVGAIQAVQGQRTAASRQALALAVRDALENTPCGDPAKALPAVAHFYPVAHPGPQAPLGWTLSEFSRDDLRNELTSEHNLCQLAIVRSWFAPDLTAAAEAQCQPKPATND
jgi:hypothetical protein